LSRVPYKSDPWQAGHRGKFRKLEDKHRVQKAQGQTGLHADISSGRILNRCRTQKLSRMRRLPGSGLLVIERDFLGGINPAHTMNLPYPITNSG